MKPARRVALAPEVFWNSRTFLNTCEPGADAARLAELENRNTELRFRQIGSLCEREDSRRSHRPSTRIPESFVFSSAFSGSAALYFASQSPCHCNAFIEESKELYVEVDGDSGAALGARRRVQLAEAAFERCCCHRAQWECGVGVSVLSCGPAQRVVGFMGPLCNLGALPIPGPPNRRQDFEALVGAKASSPCCVHAGSHCVRVGHLRKCRFFTRRFEGRFSIYRCSPGVLATHGDGYPDWRPPIAEAVTFLARPMDDQSNCRGCHGGGTWSRGVAGPSVV